MKTFECPMYEGLEFNFRMSRYAMNGNVYIGIDCKEDDFIEPFADLTVNLDAQLSENQAFIDINNLDYGFIKFLEKQGFLTRTSHSKVSGYVTYPLYILNLNKIKEYSYGN